MDVEKNLVTQIRGGKESRGTLRPHSLSVICKIVIIMIIMRMRMIIVMLMMMITVTRMLGHFDSLISFAIVIVILIIILIIIIVCQERELYRSIRKS